MAKVSIPAPKGRGGPSVMGTRPAGTPTFSPKLPLPNRSAQANPMGQGNVPWSQATGTSAREKPEHFTPQIATAPTPPASPGIAPPPPKGN